MFGSALRIGLSRRVATYMLLFGMAAIAWFTVGFFWIGQSLLCTRNEHRCLVTLDRTASALERDYSQNGFDNMQALMEQACSGEKLLYFAVIGTDGRIRAHSQTAYLDKIAADPKGRRDQLGQVERVRFRDDDSTQVREYRVPLQSAGNDFAYLHLAVAEPNLWSTVFLTADHAPIAVFGATGLVAFGALLLYRAVRPLGDIENQLRQFARSTSTSELEMQKLPVTGGAALGWNALVDRFDRNSKDIGLDERLAKTIQSRRQQGTSEVLNSLGDGVVLTDKDASITFANQIALAMLDRKEDDFTDCKATMETWLGLADLAEPAAEELLDTSLHSRRVIAEMKLNSGEVERVYRIARNPIRGLEGSDKAGFAWTLRDVTQQKLAETMRNQFLDVATHELRTPLANIQAYSETLGLADGIDVEQQKEFCNIINAESKRLTRIINELLSVSSMEAGSLTLDTQKVDLERLFEEISSKVKPEMDAKQIAFELVVPEKIPHVQLDKDKFQAALVNLLGNAAKYTPEHGRVTLRLRVDEDQLHIDVEDSGFGISEEELPRVFDKFFRSSDQRVQQITGTGLGLAFVQEVANLHNGSVSVESRLSKGCTFTMRVPRK